MVQIWRSPPHNKKSTSMFCTPFTPDVVAANCTCHPAYELTHEIGLPETCAAVLGTRDARLYLNLVIASILFVSTLVLFLKELSFSRFCKIFAYGVLKMDVSGVNKNTFPNLADNSNINETSVRNASNWIIIFTIGILIVVQVLAEALVLLFVDSSESIAAIISTVAFFPQLIVEGRMTITVRESAAKTATGSAKSNSEYVNPPPLWLIKGTLLIFGLVSFIGLLIEVVDLISHTTSERITTTYVIYSVLCGMSSALTVILLLSFRPFLDIVYADSKFRNVYLDVLSTVNMMMMRLLVLIVMALSLAFGPMTNGASLAVVHFAWFVSLSVFGVFLIGYSLERVQKFLSRK